MKAEELKPNKVLWGPIFPEPVQVIVTIPMGDAVKLVGKGVNTSRVYEPILTSIMLEALETTPDIEPYDGDPQRFRLGIEAMRLALAFEYDPYFSLSIARVDPLPHQLEAVYEYFMALPRIRFLLADDPGAGKTIMAGLLIKELKIRGLVTRTLIITPANLSFQWQREMKDKFREQFEIIRSDVLRANYGSNPWQERNQVITSLSWVSRIEDAKESLLRSHWDLIIVDEAHKMSAASRDKKTLAYQLGEALSQLSAVLVAVGRREERARPLLSQLESAHGAGGGGELVRFEAHPLEHRDEQIRQRVVAIGIERQVLPVPEPAAGKDCRQVGGHVGVGVTEVRAVKNHRAVQQGFPVFAGGFQLSE
jgi:nucleoside-triphosphatase THEP1